MQHTASLAHAVHSPSSLSAVVTISAHVSPDAIPCNLYARSRAYWKGGRQRQFALIRSLGANSIATSASHEGLDRLHAHLGDLSVLRSLLRLVSIVHCHQAVSTSDHHKPAQLAGPIRAGYRHAVYQWRVEGLQSRPSLSFQYSMSSGWLVSCRRQTD